MRIRPLIPDEGYSVAWTRTRGRTSPFGVGNPAGFDQGSALNLPNPQNPVDALNDQLMRSGINPDEATNEYAWLSRASALFIPSSVSTQQPLLLADNYRNLLILQNLSNLTVSTDVAPNLLIAYDGPVVPVSNGSVTLPQAVALNGITLQPGVSLLLDERVPTNSIYVAWGTSLGTPLFAGSCSYGRTPNSPPLSPLTRMKIDLVQQAQSAYAGLAHPGQFPGAF